MLSAQPLLLSTREEALFVHQPQRSGTVQARHLAVIAPPTPGHLNPLVALGTSLQAEGHRVTLVHLSDVERSVAGSDIGFAPLGGAGDRAGLLDEYLERLARPTGVWGMPRMIKATGEITEKLLDGLPRALERIGADAVIADSVEPAGALVARHLGLPFVTSVTGLPLLREPGVPPPFVGWDYRNDRRGLNRNAGGYAVSDLLMRPITRLLARRAAEWGLTAELEGSTLLQVAQCPAGLDFPRSALPMAFRYGGAWRLPQAPVPRPSEDGRPLVFCSLGTLQGTRRALFATMTEACARIGARAVVAHGGGLSEADVASLPGDPLVRPLWPQLAVLAHCVAAITHGGFNSVLDALAAQVPMVVLPIAFEQPGTAARLARVGAGRVLSPSGLGVARLADALARVIGDPSYREAARRLCGAMEAGGGTTRAAALVSMALRGEPVPPA